MHQQGQVLELPSTGADGGQLWAYRLGDLNAREIAAWRMTIPAGHRFEATQALRQVLAHAVQWQLIDTNPALVGVTNPVPVRREMRPFESWPEIDAVATAIGPGLAPLVRFAAATGLRPGELPRR